MTRQARFVVIATVPDYYGPVQEEDLLSLCTLKHGGHLPPSYQLNITGGDFVPLGHRLKSGREGWRQRVFEFLKRSSPRRYTASELADAIGIRGTDAEDRKAFSEHLQRMATRGTIKRERQAGTHYWDYWV